MGAPSVKKNVLVNYIGQAYIMILGIVMVPVYLRYMGKEAYGLVGFFTMLSSWLTLLDLGMSGTCIRETAAYRSGAITRIDFRQLISSLEGVFLITGSMVAIIFIFSSPMIGRYWIHREALPLPTISSSICLMGIIFALRWQTTIRRSIILGMEKQIWLNAINMLIATIRYFGVIAVFCYIGTKPELFFSFQLVITAIEFLVIFFFVKHFLPSVEKLEQWSLKPLKRIFNFSASIAAVSLLGTAMSNVDKMVLSKILTLSDYACFSVAITLSGLLGMITAPISQAVLPRLTTLYSKGDEQMLRKMYKDITQTLTTIAIPTSLGIALNAKLLLYAWTGDRLLSEKTALVLSLYAISNGISAVSSVIYYLQYALGVLKYHLIYTIISSIILLPLIVLSTIRWGMIGPAVIWMVTNVLVIVFWSAFIHTRFLPKLHVQWFLQDIILPAFVGSLPILIIFFVSPEVISRWKILAIVGFAIITGILCAGLTTRPGKMIFLNLHDRTKWFKFNKL